MQITQDGHMPSAAPLVIRPPAVIRAYVAAFLVFWIVVVVWTTMIKHHGSSIAVGILFVGLGLALGFRLLRLGVTEQPNGDLQVRNNLGGRRLSRADVEGFRLGVQGGMRLAGNTVQALLTDNTIYSIDVTRTPSFLGGGRQTRQLAALQAWLSTSS